MGVGTQTSKGAGGDGPSDIRAQGQLTPVCLILVVSLLLFASVTHGDTHDSAFELLVTRQDFKRIYFLRLWNVNERGTGGRATPEVRVSGVVLMPVA